MEKGLEAVKKLPRKFPSLAESFGANPTRDVAFLITSKRIYNHVLFTEKYVCHSYHFHVSEEIQFSFFKRLKFLSAETFLHLNIISAIKVPLLFYLIRFGTSLICISSEFALADRKSTHFCRNILFSPGIFLQTFVLQKDIKLFFSDIPKSISAATFL